MDYYDLYDITPEQEAKMEHEHLLEALVYALRTARQWGECAHVCSSWKGKKCDCDWPKVKLLCDAALAKAETQPVEWDYQAEMRGVTRKPTQ